METFCWLILHFSPRKRSCELKRKRQGKRNFSHAQCVFCFTGTARASRSSRRALRHVLSEMTCARIPRGENILFICRYIKFGENSKDSNSIRARPLKYGLATYQWASFKLFSSLQGELCLCAGTTKSHQIAKRLLDFTAIA